MLFLLLLALAHADPRPPRRCEVASPWVGPPIVATTPDPTADAGLSGPIDGALPADLTRALDAALDEALAASHAVGLQVTVALPGVGTWSGVRGRRTIGDDAPLRLDDRLQIASAGKLFTATATWRLVDRGLLDVTTPVARWFPDVPNGGALTLDHLLAHTGGLAPSRVLGDHPAVDSVDDVLDDAFRRRPLFCPGAAFAYSNLGYLLLGRVLERVTGESLARVLTDEVIAPAGLDDTVAQPLGGPLGSTVDGHHAGAVVTDVDYTAPQGAGTVASTSSDLVRLLHALLAGRVVSAPRVDAMLAPLHPWVEADMAFGRGLMRLHPDGTALYGHSGGITGFRSFAYADPDDDVIVAVLSNDEVAVPAVGWLLIRAVRSWRASR